MAVDFIRKIEDFDCNNCGKKVKGNGFTNHCPHCLWSKHVDLSPGDRASRCRGLMRPVNVEQEGDSYILTHRCEKCGYEKRNKISDDDNFEEMLKLAKTNPVI